MNNTKTLLTLFKTFFKIGLFTFGGGYAMIPLIQFETSIKHKWISEKEIIEIIAISESTPGPIAVNVATFLGYRICGFFGAFVATLGVVLPAFLVISVVTTVFRSLWAYKVVKCAFIGIRAGVLALILNALFNLYKQFEKNRASYILMALAFILVTVFKINVLVVIAGCAVWGIVFAIVAQKKVG